MKLSEKQLKKELLKIQIEKEKKELEQLNESNKIYRFNKISFKRSTILRTGKNLFVLFLTIPVFYVYFSEFIVPITKYENYKLLDDISKSYDSLFKSKKEIENQRTRLNYLYSRSIKFKENVTLQNEKMNSIYFATAIIQSYLNELDEVQFERIKNDFLESKYWKFENFSVDSLILLVEKEYSNQNLSSVISNLSRSIKIYDNIIHDSLIRYSPISKVLNGEDIFYLIFDNNYEEYKKEISLLNVDLIMYYIDKQHYLEIQLIKFTNDLDSVLNLIEPHE